MSEDGEIWEGIRKDGQAKRRRNEEMSIALLSESGIKYEVLSKDSCHYRVGRFSFWPTTGKYYDPKTGEKGRGVFKLIRIIKRDGKRQK
jgi:hypothetical protein